MKNKFKIENIPQLIETYIDYDSIKKHQFIEMRLMEKMFADNLHKQKLKGDEIGQNCDNA